MGHPRVTKHKKFDTPLKPFDKTRLEKEKYIRQQYGLRRKREIWRAESILRGFRGRARELLASPSPQRQEELFKRLQKMGFRVGKIEDVLGLKLDDLMSRRLQTVVWKRGLASTPKQARQMIVHRHITVGDRVVRWPSYIVLAEEDDKISVSPKMKPKVVGAEAPTGALL